MVLAIVKIRPSDAGNGGVLHRKEEIELQLENQIEYHLTTGKQKSQLLYNASLTGNILVVNFLLSLKADPNACNQDGTSALFVAAQEGHLDVVQMLLDYRADANATRKDTGSGPLHIASCKGHTDVAKALLEARANVNIYNKAGESSLFLAAQNGHDDMVNLLLERGAKDINKERALNIASAKGYVPVVKLLLKEGYDGFVQLLNASLVGNIEIVKTLLEAQEGVDNCTLDKFWPLFLASKKGHLDVVRVLLKYGADKTISRKKDGATPLYIPSFKGHPDIVKELLDQGPGPYKDTLDVNGASALFVACQNDHLSVVELLLKAGADKEKKRSDGASPLYIAASGGHIDIVQVLLGAGAKRNSSTNDGASALFVACQNDHLSVVELLLKAGADKEKRRSDGASPLYIAASKGHTNIVKKILAAGANQNNCDNEGASVLFIACQEGHLPVVELLLKAGANKEKKRNDGASPLYIASSGGYTDIVQLLLVAGAKRNSSTNDGESALFVACQKGHTKVVKLLLEANAETETQTHGGATPLSIASANRYEVVVDLLLAQKASFDWKWGSVLGFFSINICYTIHSALPNKGEPLQEACKKGHWIAVQELLDAGANFEVRQKEGKTPLNIADQYEDEPVHTLLTPMAKKASQLNKGSSPLFVAALKGHGHVCRCLLQFGAKQSTGLKQMLTPLHGAAIGGHVGVAKEFHHDRNTDIGTKDQFGNTPIHLASMFGHLEFVKCMVEDFRSPLSPGLCDLGPKAWAAICGHRDVALYLQGIESANNVSINYEVSLQLMEHWMMFGSVALLKSLLLLLVDILNTHPQMLQKWGDFITPQRIPIEFSLVPGIGLHARVTEREPLMLTQHIPEEDDQRTSPLNKGHILRIYIRNISVFVNDTTIPPASRDTFRSGLLAFLNEQESGSESSEASDEDEFIDIVSSLTELIEITISVLKWETKETSTKPTNLRDLLLKPINEEINSISKSDKNQHSLFVIETSTEKGNAMFYGLYVGEESGCLEKKTSLGFVYLPSKCILITVQGSSQPCAYKLDNQMKEHTTLDFFRYALQKLRSLQKVNLDEGYKKYLPLCICTDYVYFHAFPHLLAGINHALLEKCASPGMPELELHESKGEKLYKNRFTGQIFSPNKLPRGIKYYDFVARCLEIMKEVDRKCILFENPDRYMDPLLTKKFVSMMQKVCAEEGFQILLTSVSEEMHSRTSSCHLKMNEQGIVCKITYAIK